MRPPRDFEGAAQPPLQMALTLFSVGGVQSAKKCRRDDKRDARADSLFEPAMKGTGSGRPDAEISASLHCICLEELQVLSRPAKKPEGLLPRHAPQIHLCKTVVRRLAP